MSVLAKYTIVHSTNHKDPFFRGDGNVFDSKRKARFDFETYAQAHPDDADLKVAFGYYFWEIWALSSQGTPIVFEERLSVKQDNKTPNKDLRYMLFACMRDGSSILPMPTESYETEGKAMNALLDLIHKEAPTRELFFKDAILADVREVHLPDVPQLKANYTRYFERFPDKETQEKRAKEKEEKAEKRKKGKDSKGTVQYSYTTTNYKCHTGNNLILSNGKHGLYAGGLSKEVKPGPGMVVIDLAGGANSYQSHGRTSVGTELVGSAFPTFMKASKLAAPFAWLDMPLADFQAPYHITPAMWKAMETDLLKALKNHDVLAFCQGGHGRTGIFMCIVAFLLASDPAWTGDKPAELLADPVVWLRKIYCKEAVDNVQQHRYIYATLGLKIDVPEPPKVVYQAAVPPAAPSSAPIVHSGKGIPAVGAQIPQCPRCGNLSIWVDDYGICTNCQRALKEEMIAKNMVHAVCNFQHCKNNPCHGVTLCKCGHVVHGQACGASVVCDKCFEGEAATSWQHYV